MKNRRDFIKLGGLFGVASLIPLPKVFSADKSTAKSDCVLIPSETPGPFPLDLTNNSAFFRQDIREAKTGVQLNLKMRIIGEENCLPLENARVNIWQCDKDGLYSGYDQSGNSGQQNLTYLRGYQLTNSNGEVNFITILPGLYTGRICHIHFQVYVSSAYSAVSQLTFEIDTKQLIYSNNPTLYTKGQDPLNFNTDNVFSDGYEMQVATLSATKDPMIYNSFLEVTVKGAGKTAGHIEKENAKQFALGQNFPNPYKTETTILFSLKEISDVALTLYNLQGQKLKTFNFNKLTQGNHSVYLNMQELNLPCSNYAYQIEITNSMGVFKDCKMMSVISE